MNSDKWRLILISSFATLISNIFSLSGVHYDQHEPIFLGISSVNGVSSDGKLITYKDGRKVGSRLRKTVGISKLLVRYQICSFRIGFDLKQCHIKYFIIVINGLSSCKSIVEIVIRLICRVRLSNSPHYWYLLLFTQSKCCQAGILFNILYYLIIEGKVNG